MPAPDSGSGGTRQPAFLRPLPGQRLESTTGDGYGRAGEVLDRLFPRALEGDASDAAPVTCVGVRLGHFVVEERIGHGGMGGVFRAVDERLNRIVALKVLAPGHARDSGAVERFRNEAQAAARLDHENISRVYYIGDDQHVPFIAFEFVRGTNVRDFILEKGVLSPADAVNYVLQIAQALRHTQAAGVVHRDIKPSNIIITPSGHAKLVDLGLARQEQLEPARELTVPGTTLGTFDYIAPEQARDPRTVDVRADIYSLGCTLYHMLTGQPPFPQGTIIQKVVDHHRDAPPDPADRNPLVPPALSRVVRKMMASNPDERQAGPEELVHELSQVAAGLGLRPVHADNLIWIRQLYEPQPGFFQQNKGWLLTLAALILIAFSINNMPDGWLTADSPSRTAASPETLTRDSQIAPGQPSDDEPTPPPSEPAVADSGSSADSRPGGFRSLMADLLPSTSSLEPQVRDSGAVAPLAPQEPLEPAIEDVPTPVVDVESPADSVVREIDQFTSPVPGGRTPPTGNRPEAPITTSQPFVVMDEGSRTETGFETLEAACQQAASGGLIELRFDGRPPTPQPPVRIQNKRLTIRAQRDRRPAIEFDSQSATGQSHVTRMFQVIGGELQLQNVELLMPVQSGADDGWALFSLVQAERFGLQGVSIVVTNPDRQPAAIVELVPPPGLDPQEMMPESMRREQVQLDWRHCLIRGECDLLSNSTLDPVDVVCENVAVAVQGAFLRVLGRVSTDGRVGNDDRRLSLQLRHVTALLSDGLIRVDTSYDIDRDFLPIDVETHDSAVIVRPRQPLVVISANREMSALQRRLRWQSSWSAFDVTGPVWEIRQALEGQQLPLDFGDLGIPNQQVIEKDLLEQPLNWTNTTFTSLTEASFRLRKEAASSARNSRTGVEFNDRIPPAGVFASSERSKAAALP